MNKKYINGILVALVLIVGYLIVDNILFDGVKPKAINQDGFQANYFAASDSKSKIAVVILGGGQWGDYWGEQFARQGYCGLSLPYTRREGLPSLPEEIDLEYFKNALKWLQHRPEVNKDKIVVMGASRNAELALLIASKYPEFVHGVVAYSPSSVSWSNTVLPYNSDTIKSSWKFKGEDIPFVPMTKLKGNDSNKIETLSYWKSGLDKTDYVTKATIKVEQINGPILLFSGLDDKVWPSSFMAKTIEKRINANNFLFQFQSITYENAGHSISSHPEIDDVSLSNTIHIDGIEHEYQLGGTIEGNRIAKIDAKQKLFDFLDTINSSPKKNFECHEYWITKNTDWQVAYDDVKYCNSELIIMSADSVWGIMYPGSLSLKSDTIIVNQESGYPNECYKIGYVKVGKSKKVNILGKTRIFNHPIDTLIKFDNHEFIKSNKTVTLGCWCDWKD